MKALTYIEHGKFALTEKPKPQILDPRDAVVRVTLGSICTSDLHIKHGSVPRAVPGITVGHEMVGVVESVGTDVKNLKPGNRVAVNVETFCGECFFCKKGFVNNCTDPNGGWALGCRIDGGQAEYVRVPYADQGLTPIPASVTDEQALFVGDVLATGFWAARISEITPEDTVLIIGAGPTGVCTLLCVMLKNPKCIIVCEKDPARMDFVKQHYPDVLVCTPEECEAFTLANSDHGGADVVLEVAGAKDTFELAWRCARPNAIVTVVALYDEAQCLPLPDMYGKNLIFKTGGVDGCDCAEILRLIEEGKIDTTPLITHRFKLEDIEEAYRVFENKLDGVIKIAISPLRRTSMIYAAEDRKSEKHYTFLPKLFDVIDNAQLQYNWLITACEFNVANPIEDEYFARGYCWISGKELTSIVRENDIQWIWGILSGFDKDIPFEEVMAHPLPDFIDGADIRTIIHPLSKVQIIAFDSSGTQFFSTEAALVSKFRAGYPQSEDITDDSAK